MARADLASLPDEVRQLIEPIIADNPATLDAIGVAIGAKRDDAKKARSSSGIEEIWKECEEAYIGIDDANRTDFKDAKWAKPMSMDGPVTTGRDPQKKDHKSTVFVRLTARYVDAGSAKLGEILLPADDKAFSFSETPVPELIKAKEDSSQVFHEGLGVPLTRPAQPGEVAPPSPQPGGAGAPLPPVTGLATAGAVGGPQLPPTAGTMGAAGAVPAPQVPLTVKDLALENIEIARKKAKSAETRIYDWMVECQYTAEMRKVIDDAARIGVGVLKAPVPKSKRSIVVKKSDGGGVNVELKESIKPAARWCDPWNVFPDPACGENIHNGDYLLERDWMTQRQVKDLKKLPGYIGAQIDKVIEEGPDKSAKDEDMSSNPSLAQQKGRFEIWYFYGALKRSDVLTISVAAGKMENIAADQKEVFVIVTLINDSVVRATINPLDSGSFPYHSVPWQRRSGHWAGVGVAEQLKTPQRMINAATRAMLNNAGKSSGSQVVLDRAQIRPMDNDWTITPDKLWEKMPDSPGDDVRKAFFAFEIPNTTPQLMTIIEYALKLAEESTSIPLITQGQTGPTQPDTLGATNIQNNNANQLLRSIGYAFDDYITEPVVRQFYEWLLIDPDVPDDEKGDFTINAHGSVALVERAIQDQTIAQMGQMAANPIYGVDPKKWAKMFFKSKRLNPEDLQYTQEEQAKIDAAPKPQDPRIEAAKINADANIKLGVMKSGLEKEGLEHDKRVEQAAAIIEGGRVDAEDRRTATDATLRLHELQMQHDMAVLGYANQHRMKVADVHAALLKQSLDHQHQQMQPPELPAPAVPGGRNNKGPRRPEIRQ